MTTDELTGFLNKTFGAEKDWPKLLAVREDTYGCVCQTVFEKLAFKYRQNPGQKSIEVRLGPNNGIMFKNVELIKVAS
jgi:hypothetical protein